MREVQQTHIDALESETGLLEPLTKAVTLTQSLNDAQSGAFDEDAVGEYLSLVILERHRYEGIYGALRAVKKWSRVQPHWKRIRRRICWGCARQVALTEPRYLVCAGCGKARYCSEACQRADWAEHQKVCPAGQPGWNAAVDSR